MESNEYNSGFEHFLREKADQYKLYPSDRVWAAVNDKLHPRKRWPYVLVAAIFIGLGIGGNIHDSLIAGGHQNNNTKDLSNRFPQTTAVVPSLIAEGSVPGAETVIPPTGSNHSGITEALGKSPVSPSLRIVHVNAKPEAVDARIDLGNKLKPVHAHLASVEEHVKENINGSLETEVTTPSTTDLESGSLVMNNQLHLLATVSKNAANSDRKLIAGNKKDIPKTTAIRVMKPYKNMFGLQFYVAPSVSYRRLSGQGIKTFNSPTGNYNYSDDVNNVVDQQAMTGVEAGAALVFSMNKKLRFKTGLQFNMSQYEVRAYQNSAELVPMTAAGIGHSQVNAISVFRSTGSGVRSTLRNQRMMLSIPIGAEWTVINKNRIQFNVAGSIQPTYVINNQSYMVSSDLKNYAQSPSLYRNFNLNTGFEAFITFRTGATKWNIGPQLRYQLMSSYKSEYPIKEHLMEYGFKVGMTRTLW
ncbi:MAG: hypothetical protein ACK5OP_04200 [Sphingobacteriales bacterium]